MDKKSSSTKQNKNHNSKKSNSTSTLNQLSYGQKAADKLTAVVGSWSFIIGLFIFMFIWMLLNTFMIIKGVWDPYPFILLNFVLSCLAAIQAPIILMSQNRTSEQDRKRFEYDYQVNRKAEREITEIQNQLRRVERLIRKK